MSSQSLPKVQEISKRDNGCVFGDCITEPCIKKHPMKSKKAFCTGYSNGKKRNRIQVTT